MPSVAIITGNHLCHNPRVIKEATALHQAGYRVEVLGGWFDPVLKARDLELMSSIKFEFRPLQDLTAQPALRLRLRLWGRLAKLVHAKTGCETRWQLGYLVSELQKATRRNRADLFIAHSEQALWAVAQLQKSVTGGLRTEAGGPGIRVGVDMEDWFSEDLPPETRRHRPIKLLRWLEQGVLGRAAHSTCTSHAVSEALAKDYGCLPPTVIYNAFPWSDRQSLDGQSLDRRDLRVPSIHWYSQTLGMDRGLDDLFSSLPQLRQQAEIHLRGKLVAGFANWLASHVPENWRKRVFVHELVSNDELLSRIAEHDIGFAGEPKVCRNRDLTVSNKILHYLLGGLAVVASDTTGQNEIAESANGAVRIYRSGDSASLAQEMNALLTSAELLQASKAAALTAVEQIFCWERQAPILLDSVKGALAA